MNSNESLISLLIDTYIREWRRCTFITHFRGKTVDVPLNIQSEFEMNADYMYVKYKTYV